jgi:hypothetical protein
MLIVLEFTIERELVSISLAEGGVGGSCLEGEVKRSIGDGRFEGPWLGGRVRQSGRVFRFVRTEGFESGSLEEKKID